ncbi:MAG: formylglycine-generating enzyme family protein [Planctomycetota bacterium]|jgi:formylglycine-generating enzyme required for sulfatase activity
MHRSSKYAGVALVAGALALGCGKAPIPASASPDGKSLAFDFGDGVTMELALIPAGEFMMGNPNYEEEYRRDEGPHHLVRITKPFHMSRHEVTQSQYERVMDANPSHFKGADLPVEQVSWDDAAEFCRRLSQRTGRTVRLPTEAEWEYACRAGTTTPFHYGGSLCSEQANFNGDNPYGGAPKGVRRGTTMPVGSFEPNAWGLYDMHGNLKEWCFDRWDEDYYKSSPEEDPTGPASGVTRVKRGGCWYDLGSMCRSAARDTFPQICSNYYIGFRVVASASPGR